MNNKVTIAVSTALLSMATMQASASTVQTQYLADSLKSVAPISINKGGTYNKTQVKKFRAEKDLAGGTYTYIVRLEDQPVATYDGSVAGLTATNPQIAKKSLFKSLANSKKSSKQIRKELRLDFQAPEIIAYSNYLEAKHQAFLTKASGKLGNNLNVTYQYKNAFNGMAVRLTQKEAQALSAFADVAYVEREKTEHLETDTGPIHVGAPLVWDGQGQSAVNMGEGVIIGVLDTGANTDHRSFADVGDDGYDHTNPWGAGVYAGDCAGDFATLCNDKLIGIRSYAAITDSYDDADVFGSNPPAKNGEDYGGHGSHTASTAGGNILYDVPLVDPETGELEGDGINTTGFEFAQISGVAPHANIVAYQICHGGDTGDTYSGCPGAAIIAALDDALVDGVDVINYSISGGGDPWVSSTELGFLAAQEAGIFSSVSAGNSGPEAFTTSKNAPWYTVVGASTHGREVAFEKEIGAFTGGATELTAIEGQSASQGITANIVWAGDYANSNDPDGDPAQCLQPFPTDTFSGEIVVCDRGAIARVQKAINAADGGAGGFVLGNVDGGSNTVANDVYVVPGIHINAENGNVLRTWLANGEGHTATITAAVGELKIGQADDMADFSSRGGNNTVPDVMTPSVTAPGVSIYAAYSDQQFGHDETTPAPTDFSFLQGTSMSAPHVAGAGAVLKSAHPTWTPDNIRSALMLTAITDVRKEDGTTAADFFDMGAGSIRVNLAHLTGLVMNESAANYTAANPETGGDPKTLNIPSVSNANCVGLCDWTRTVTATAAGSWTVAGTAISDGLVITATPATFELAAGESQIITIDVDAVRAESDAWAFGHVVMTSNVHPTARIPVSVQASNGNIPDKLSFDANRNQDSFLIEDVMAVEITEFTSRSYGLTKADKTEATLAVDSDNGDAYDDLSDGINVTLHTVPADAKRFVAEILASESPDLDLRVGLDTNGDGIPQEDEEVGISATGTALEKVDLIMPEAGSYWVAVQNWSASEEDAKDAYTLATAIVDGEVGDNLAVEADMAIPALTEFDLRVKWSLDGATQGDMYYGALDLGTNFEDAGNLGLVSVDLMRGMDDVSISSDADTYVERNTKIDYEVSVLAKVTPNDRTYTIKATLPAEMTLDKTSVTSDATISGNEITWTVVQESLFGIEPFYTKTTNADDASCALPDLGQGSGYLDLAAFGILPGELNGDTVTATYPLAANFLGKSYSSVSVTDDGFIYLGGSAGSSPWVNQLLPNAAEANNLIAPFWRDMEIVRSDTSGVSTVDTGRYSIIEFDDMRHYFFHNGQADVADNIDFEVLFDNVTGNIMFAYDNVTHVDGAALGVTVGLENATGTLGRTDVYATSPYNGGEAGSVGDISDIYSGLVICYELTSVDSSPTVVKFSAEVADEFLGGPVDAIVLSSTTNDVNTVAVNSSAVMFQVEGAPTAVITGSTAVVETESVQLSAANSSDPNGDALTYAWVQMAGTPVAFNASAESISFTAPKVSKDETISFQLTVNDGNGNSDSMVASVSIVNKKESGSFGWLMLLLTPMLFTRRKKA
ncbi:S8 family peptidase [Colwellia sp. C1TZA3]|uniref:S8 family peptidase n=1 Tax=Colwellia sp. C1TZA3 TaxID=2508879 RepID=UPI0011BA0A8B|nr:S8 family peptidase [Colwellia sp. C1TZA3]TWX73021.1 S8 family serine peptidase [Colwellia sp. C1TZA3]